eukprot:9474909-Pyramimonas_sp.AAC.1
MRLHSLTLWWTGRLAERLGDRHSSTELYGRRGGMRNEGTTASCSFLPAPPVANAPATVQKMRKATKGEPNLNLIWT